MTLWSKEFHHGTAANGPWGPWKSASPCCDQAVNPARSDSDDDDTIERHTDRSSSLARGGPQRPAPASHERRYTGICPGTAGAARRAQGVVRPLDLSAHFVGTRGPDATRVERRSRGDGADNIFGAKGDGAPRLCRPLP